METELLSKHNMFSPEGEFSCQPEQSPKLTDRDSSQKTFQDHATKVFGELMDEFNSRPFIDKTVDGYNVMMYNHH